MVPIFDVFPLPFFDSLPFSLETRQSVSMLRILGNHLLGRHKATAHGSFPGAPPRPPSPTGKGRPRPQEPLAVPGGLRTVQGWGNVLCFGGRDAHDYVCLLSSQMSSSSHIPSGTGSASAVSTWRVALRLGPQSGMFPSSNHSPPRTSQSTSPPTPQPTAQRARVPPPIPSSSPALWPRALWRDGGLLWPVERPSPTPPPAGGGTRSCMQPGLWACFLF